MISEACKYHPFDTIVPPNRNDLITESVVTSIPGFWNNV